MAGRLAKNLARVVGKKKKAKRPAVGGSVASRLAGRKRKVSKRVA